MASSASGQDEPNRALWLATRAGKMEPSSPLETTRCIPQANFSKSHIINPLLTKFVRSRWLDIGLVLFLCELMDLDFLSVHKHAKRELGQYPAILTSHLPWVPEVFFSLGTTELSGEAAKESREAARKKPLAPTDNNLTSMPTPVSFDWHPPSELILETQQAGFTHVE